MDWREFFVHAALWEPPGDPSVPCPGIGGSVDRQWFGGGYAPFESAMHLVSNILICDRFVKFPDSRFGAQALSRAPSPPLPRRPHGPAGRIPPSGGMGSAPLRRDGPQPRAVPRRPAPFADSWVRCQMHRRLMVVGYTLSQTGACVGLSTKRLCFGTHRNSSRLLSVVGFR